MEPQERQGAGQYMLIVSYSLESVYSTSQEQDQEACKVCGCKKAQGYYGRAWILGETVGYIPRDSIIWVPLTGTLVMSTAILHDVSTKI